MPQVCPVGFLCFDSNTVALLFGLLLITFAYITIHNKKQLHEMTEKKAEVLTTIHNQTKILEKETHTSMPATTPIQPSSTNVYIMPSPTTESVLVNKDYERLINPLLAPERSYDGVYRVPINIPTRGYDTNYQQVGTLQSDDKILPLYGKPRWTGAHRWNYYTNTDGYNTIKLPVYNTQDRNCLDDNGCDELYDGDKAIIPQYGKDKTFGVTVYQMDKPRYIPFMR
jgi:hypothetical protein